jgi:hypothetical protein
LGDWPSMGISDARKAAQAKKLEVAHGIDPNEIKREAVRQAVQAAANRRTLGEVLDQYEAVKLVQLRRGAAVRRSLDGKTGVLRHFVTSLMLARSLIGASSRRSSKPVPSPRSRSPPRNDNATATTRSMNCARYGTQRIRSAILLVRSTVYKF